MIFLVEDQCRSQLLGTWTAQRENSLNSLKNAQIMLNLAIYCFYRSRIKAESSFGQTLKSALNLPQAWPAWLHLNVPVPFHWDLILWILMFVFFCFFSFTPTKPKSWHQHVELATKQLVFFCDTAPLKISRMSSNQHSWHWFF